MQYQCFWLLYLHCSALARTCFPTPESRGGPKISEDIVERNVDVLVCRLPIKSHLLRLLSKRDSTIAQHRRTINSTRRTRVSFAFSSDSFVTSFSTLYWRQNISRTSLRSLNTRLCPQPTWPSYPANVINCQVLATHSNRIRIVTNEWMPHLSIHNQCQCSEFRRLEGIANIECGGQLLWVFCFVSVE